jgi:2'-5' RNA ligase
VLWSAPECTPQALQALATTLNDALVPCGHHPESRPFSAHITLARKVGRAVKQTEHSPVPWHVDAFHLVESETHPQGARYRRVRSWALQ